MASVMMAPSFTVPMVGMVQQPTNVVSICPAARPADRAPVYLMFLLNKPSDDQTVDQQVALGRFAVARARGASLSTCAHARESPR